MTSLALPPFLPSDKPFLIDLYEHSFPEEERRPKILAEKQFYIFWMILHRRRTVLFDDDHLGEDSPYREIALQHPELAAISIDDMPGCIEQPGFTISNMNIKVEIHHGLS